MHEYFGFTPSFAQAFFNGEPGLKLAFFAPYVKMVILSSEDERTPTGGCTTKALAHARIARRTVIKNLYIFVLYVV